VQKVANRAPESSSGRLNLAGIQHARQQGIARLLTGLALGWTGLVAAHGQGLITTADLSGVKTSSGIYDYTLTLINSPNSTAYAQTFWFAWQAGQADFMGSMPTQVQAAPGWTSEVVGDGSGDGYSLKFVSSTAPLAPGSSINFYFSSPDSPKVMAGPSPIYPEYPVLSSDVYSGFTSGIREDIIAQLVPEPSTWALLVAGGLMLSLVAFRRR